MPPATSPTSAGSSAHGTSRDSDHTTWPERASRPRVAGMSARCICWRPCTNKATASRATSRRHATGTRLRHSWVTGWRPPRWHRWAPTRRSDRGAGVRRETRHFIDAAVGGRWIGAGHPTHHRPASHRHERTWFFGLIRRWLQGETFVPAAQAFEITRSRAHGHVQAAALAIQRLGLSFVDCLAAVPRTRAGIGDGGRAQRSKPPD